MKKKLYMALIGLIAITMVGCGGGKSAQTTTETDNKAVEEQTKEETESLSVEESSTVNDNTVEQEKNTATEKNIVSCTYGVDFRINYEDKTPEEIEIINSAIEKLNSMTQEERYRLYTDEVEIENTQWDTTEENIVISYLLRVEFAYNYINFESQPADELEKIVLTMNNLYNTTKAEREEMYYNLIDKNINGDLSKEDIVLKCILSIELENHDYNSGTYDSYRAKYDKDFSDSLNATNGANYIASVKIQKEELREKNKELMLEIINNDSSTDEQKRTAIDSIDKNNNLAEKEEAAETLLKSIGFEDVMVSIAGDEVMVTINRREITDEEKEQINNIITSETGLTVENIYIDLYNVEY